MESEEADQLIIVYGTGWCPDVAFARRYLDRHGIAYTYLDIDASQQAMSELLDISGADWLVPTIVFPDGTVLSNPSTKQLANRLGHSKRKKDNA